MPYGFTKRLLWQHLLVWLYCSLIPLLLIAYDEGMLGQTASWKDIIIQVLMWPAILAQLAMFFIIDTLEWGFPFGILLYLLFSLANAVLLITIFRGLEFLYFKLRRKMNIHENHKV